MPYCKRRDPVIGERFLTIEWRDGIPHIVTGKVVDVLGKKWTITEWANGEREKIQARSVVERGIQISGRKILARSVEEAVELEMERIFGSVNKHYGPRIKPRDVFPALIELWRMYRRLTIRRVRNIGL